MWQSGGRKIIKGSAGGDPSGTCQTGFLTCLEMIIRNVQFIVPCLPSSEGEAMLTAYEKKISPSPTITFDRKNFCQSPYCLSNH